MTQRWQRVLIQWKRFIPTANFPLEYGFTEHRQPTSYSPPSTIHRIETPSLVGFGPSIRHGQVLKRSSVHPCGFTIDISSGKALINLLSFDTLKVNGRSKGRWTVALADNRLAALEENYPIGEIHENCQLSFPLDKAAEHLDLKRTKYIVFILQSRSGELQIDNLEFSRTASSPPSLANPAIWVWDNRPARSDASSMVRNLKTLQVRRIYLQISDELEPLFPFIRECAASGIEVFALDGSPSYLDHPEPLLNRVRAVREFNSRHPGTPFAGFQIDIEPHLNKDFRIRLDTYGSLYVELMNEIRQITEGISFFGRYPFWFTHVFDDRDSGLALSTTDEVASYYRPTLRK